MAESLHFSIQLLIQKLGFGALGLQVQIKGSGQVSESLHFPSQLLIQKLGRYIEPAH